LEKPPTCLPARIFPGSRVVDNLVDQICRGGILMGFGDLAAVLLLSQVYKNINKNNELYKMADDEAGYRLRP
jgi:hypothetical protein